MNIVILGAGNIGSYLAAVLSEQGNNVVVIDYDAKALEKVALSADVATRLGSGTDWRLLEDLRDIKPDFFIALSSDDETNLTACAIAKNLGYRKTIARIRQESFLDHSLVDINHLFSVDHIIGTELIIAHDIFKSIINPGNIAVENFAHGAVQMRTIVIPEHFSEINKPLAQLNILNNLLVGLIRRKGAEGHCEIIFPKGNDALHAGDEATIIGKTSAMQSLHQVIGLPQKYVHSAVIIGGSGVAIHLTRLLEAQKIKVKIIEQDERYCKELALMFPSAVVLNHDGTDLEFLKGERIGVADVLIACTRKHETNILAALVGKQAGCREVIALVSDESVIPLLQKFEISFSLSERASIERRIQVILHHETYVSLASLYENQARIMEVKLSCNSKLTGTPLAELSPSLPKNFLIAIVKNKHGITIPKGDTVLASGDTAIVICCPESMQEVEGLL